MAKRVRVLQAKAGQLRAAWGKPCAWGEPDLVYAWGANGASKPDGRILSEAFENTDVFDGKSLRVILDERGYDLTTLKFSIEQKPKA